MVIMKAELLIVISEAPGLSSEMDEGEIVPSELFGSLGLLIVESRVPHLSSKGHVEGPHIPSTSSYAPSKHLCSTNSFLCGRMEAVRRQMQVLWKNHIPMCIEVLLFPDCEHGSQLAALQDVTLPSGRDTSILLEQWTVQVLPRRGGESVARARELFQAMKSYLHFSQLSAWLNLTHGKAPRNVAYRVSPPAEFCTSSFQEHPQWHTFPICSMTKTSVIKVTVGTLPRRNNIIYVPCPEFHPLGQFVRTTSSGASVVTTKAPCRPQQTLQPPQDDGSRYRNRLAPGHGQGKHRKSLSRDQKSGFNQQGMGWEGEKQQLPAGSGTGAQPYSRKMPPSLQTSQEESQLSGESRGRGRESPGVPTHLDFNKVRHTSEQFCDYRQFLVLPQGQSDLKPDRSIQMPPFPYPQPMCPPHHHHHHHHQHQRHPSQPQPYLDPSLITHRKRSSPAVPRMDQSPFQLQQQPQQQPPYNAFLYNQPRLYPQTPEDLPSYNPMQYLGAIPKRASFAHHKSPPDTQGIRDFFPHNPPSQVDPGYFLQQPDPSQQKSVKAESPKVLFSMKSPGQVFYTREDPMWATPVATQESEGSDGSSPEIDKFLKNMSGSVQPLSPEEIQNYLSRLSFHQSRSRRDKDISPLACKSLTEKDFVEAELSQQAGDNSQHHQQQLPVKLAKALEEANKDLPLSNRLIRASSCSPKEKKEFVSEQCDERSITPTPSLSPHQVVEDLPPKLHRTKSEEEKVWLSSERSSSPKAKESKSCQTVDQSTDPTIELASTRQANGSQELPCSSSPRAFHNTSPGPSSPRDLSQEHLTKTVTSHNISKAKRPMSPLTKKLQEAETERSMSPLSMVTNGAQMLATQAVSNGVSCSNGTTEKPKEIRNTSPDATSNGHSDLSTGFENNQHTISNLPDEAVEALPYVDTLRSYEDNKNNNAKGKAKNTGHIELSVDNTRMVEDVQPSSSPVASVNEDEQKPPGKAAGPKRATPLLHSLLRKDLSEQIKSQEDAQGVSTRAVPTPQERASFRRSLDNSTNMIFHAATGLPLQSSPAPIKKRTSGCFDYDSTLTNIRAIKNSLSCANLEEQNGSQTEENEKTQGRFYSASAPASTNCLLGNFEESLLNGRIEPSGVVEGFTAELGASGTFCPKHVVLPVTAFFFNLSDDNAPSPYLGHINLDSLGRRGYHVPKKGTVQVTLFNPNKTVVKMFVVMYNLTHMPPNCQTFLRQRTLYMPVSGSPSDIVGEAVFLRYLIHLRFSSSKSGKIYLHTDLRMIFARNKFEYDSSVASYELRSFTEGPVNPKFSPKR